MKPKICKECGLIGGHAENCPEHPEMVANEAYLSEDEIADIQRDERLDR